MNWSFRTHPITWIWIGLRPYSCSSASKSFPAANYCMQTWRTGWTEVRTFASYRIGAVSPDFSRQLASNSTIHRPKWKSNTHRTHPCQSQPIFSSIYGSPSSMRRIHYNTSSQTHNLDTNGQQQIRQSTTRFYRCHSSGSHSHLGHDRRRALPSSGHRRRHNTPNYTRSPATQQPKYTTNRKLNYRHRSRQRSSATTILKHWKQPSTTTLHQHNRKQPNGTPAAIEYANHTSTSTVTTSYTSTNLQQPFETASDLQQQPAFTTYTRQHASTIGLYIQLPSTNLWHLCYPQSCTPANCTRDEFIQSSTLIACAITSQRLARPTTIHPANWTFIQPHAQFFAGLCRRTSHKSIITKLLYYDSGTYTSSCNRPVTSTDCKER